MKIIALHLKMDSRLIRNPKKLNPEELGAVRETAAMLASYPMKIVTLGAPSAVEIERRARKHIREGISFIGVDYVQQIKNGSENANADLTITSRTLKAIATNYNVPVFAASQLSRNVVHRGANSLIRRKFQKLDVLRYQSNFKPHFPTSGRYM